MLRVKLIGNFRELESVKTQVMAALKCPPPNKKLDVLEGLLLLLKH